MGTEVVKLDPASADAAQSINRYDKYKEDKLSSTFKLKKPTPYVAAYSLLVAAYSFLVAAYSLLVAAYSLLLQNTENSSSL